MALNTSGAVILFHVVVLMVVSLSVLKVTVLQVSVDVQVIVHAVRLLCEQLVGEVTLQVLQPLLGEEVGFWEHHLKGHSYFDVCVYKS